MKAKPELTAQTKQNLTEAFWQIYCTKRIDKITVGEITTRAGYNRCTFYEYFIDVYDVLQQIEDGILPKLEDFPPINLPSDPSPLPIDIFIRMYEAHRKYYKVLLGDNGDPSFLNKIKNSIKPEIKQTLIAMNISYGFEVEYIIEYTLSAMIGILCHWYDKEDAPPTERLLSLIYDLMQEGVMNKLSKL